MKKLLFVFLIFITSARAIYAQIPAGGICLNGFTFADAKAMVANFQRGVIPKPTCVWFSKDMIHKMVKLLHKEQSTNPKIDGVRIYFGKNNVGKNTLILVSTYAYGSDPTVYSGTFHQDYFTHDTSDPLFAAQTQQSFNGEICDDASCGNGARLYQPCPCYDDVLCDANSPHFISMQYAQLMVSNLTKDTVNIKAEWFDLQLLEKYDRSARYDGIRIYFARHSDSVFDSLTPGKVALVLATTEPATSAGIHKDYFDCNETKSFFKKTYKKSLKLNKDGSRQMSPMAFELKLGADNGEDRGEQCEPHCGGTGL